MNLIMQLNSDSFHNFLKPKLMTTRMPTSRKLTMTYSQPSLQRKKFGMDSEHVPSSPIFTPPYYRLYLCYIYDLCKMHWWAALGHSGISGLSLISWTGNLIEDKDNNQLRFENQNNCQNHISSTIVYHKDKPNPLFPPEKI